LLAVSIGLRFGTSGEIVFLLGCAAFFRFISFCVLCLVIFCWVCVFCFCSMYFRWSVFGVSIGFEVFFLFGLSVFHGRSVEHTAFVSWFYDMGLMSVFHWFAVAVVSWDLTRYLSGSAMLLLYFILHCV